MPYFFSYYSSNDRYTGISSPICLRAKSIDLDITYKILYSL